MKKQKLPHFFLKEEAEKYRKSRNGTVDHEKQLRLALQEIEQVKCQKKEGIYLFCCCCLVTYCFTKS